MYMLYFRFKYGTLISYPCEDRLWIGILHFVQLPVIYLFKVSIIIVLFDKDVFFKITNHCFSHLITYVYVSTYTVSSIARFTVYREASIPYDINITELWFYTRFLLERASDTTDTDSLNGVIHLYTFTACILFWKIVRSLPIIY